MKAYFELTLFGFLAACGCERTSALEGRPERVPLARQCPRPHLTGWCPVCDAGYVAAIRVPSRALFEVLDAHGHDVDPAAMTCASCRQAWSSGGYCDECRMGFARGQAYLSPLAYHVARCALEDPARIACNHCREIAANHGWCERCSVGRVGSLVVRERAEVDGTWRAVRKLERALAHLPRCETCAIAAFCDGRCRHCDASYRDGERIEPGAGPGKP